MGPRHEAQHLQLRSNAMQMRGELAQIDLEAARTALESTSAHGRAIMLGPICSPAMLHRLKPEESLKCPWCNCQFATFEHLAWRCRGLPGSDTRPPKPDLGHAEDPPSQVAGLAGIGSGECSPEPLWRRLLAQPTLVQPAKHCSSELKGSCTTSTMVFLITPSETS